MAAHAPCQAAMGKSRLPAISQPILAVARQQGGQCGKHSCPLHSAKAAQRPSCQKPGLSRSSAWWEVCLLPWLQHAVRWLDASETLCWNRAMLTLIATSVPRYPRLGTIRHGTIRHGIHHTET